jgi:flagellar hook-basal body complex protein FliE
MKAVELIKLKRKANKKELKNEPQNKNKSFDEPSIYSDDILPELLNNIGCTLLLKEQYQDVEKYLNEAKSILKEELKKLEHKYQKKEDEENRMILHPSQLLRNLMIRIEAEEVVTGVTGGHGGVGAGMNRILKVLQMTVVVIGMEGRENRPGKLLKRK